MRLLQIDSDVRGQIKKALEYAKGHKFTLSQLNCIIEGGAEAENQAAGFDPGFVTHIHDGYRVVYSLEEQPIGLCKHISISVEAPGKLPHELAVKEILKEFGMNPDFKSPKVVLWVEDGCPASINVMEIPEIK